MPAAVRVHLKSASVSSPTTWQNHQGLLQAKLAGVRKLAGYLPARRLNSRTGTGAHHPTYRISTPAYRSKLARNMQRFETRNNSHRKNGRSLLYEGGCAANQAQSSSKSAAPIPWPENHLVSGRGGTFLKNTDL